MGTNYYLHRNVCAHCGRSDEPRHIGKSSAGWCFALHVYPEDGISDLVDWEEAWSAGVIRDEYGREVAPVEMFAVVTLREPATKAPSKEWLDANYAVRGPGNLARSKLSDHCIEHGAGTWDCHVGEFS